MTSLVSPLARRAMAGVSDADFTVLETTVATNTAKPTEAEVDSQIDTKNEVHKLQIDLDYADRVNRITFRRSTDWRPLARPQQPCKT